MPPPARGRRALVAEGAVPVGSEDAVEEGVPPQHAPQTWWEVAVSAPDIEQVQIALQQARPGLLSHRTQPPGAQQRSQIGVAELSVAAEDLVSPLSVEQYLDTGLLGRAHYPPLGVEAHPGERHVLVPRHVAEDVPEVGGRREHEVGSCADGIRHLKCVLPLVQLRIFVAGSEGVELVAQGGGCLWLLPPDLADQSHYG